jgi:hypothetical protein
MARKQVALGTERQVAQALEEHKTLTELRYEVAKEAYNFQDKETKQTLDRMVSAMRLAATGYIEVTIDPPHGGIVPAKVEPVTIDMNLLYVAVDILKTLAFFDTKVANFKYPSSLCINCGAEILGSKKPRRGR